MFKQWRSTHPQKNSEMKLNTSANLYCLVHSLTLLLPNRSGLACMREIFEPVSRAGEVNLDISKKNILSFFKILASATGLFVFELCHHPPTSSPTDRLRSSDDLGWRKEGRSSRREFGKTQACNKFKKTQVRQVRPWRWQSCLTQSCNNLKMIQSKLPKRPKLQQM